MNDSYIPILESRVDELQAELSRVLAENEKLALRERLTRPYWSKVGNSDIPMAEYCGYGNSIYRIASVYYTGEKWTFSFEHSVKVFEAKFFDTREEACTYVEELVETYNAQ